MIFTKEDIYKQYLSALISGKRHQCFEIANRTKEQMPSIKELYTQLFQESLYEVGRLWEFNQISVAVEHMATAITETLMNTLYSDMVQASPKGLRAIITSTQNEYHQIGAKMVADIFELNGWDTWYLGANTPTGELIRLAHDINPHVIALSLSVYFHLTELSDMIQTIQKEYTKGAIIIGGQAFKHGNGKQFANQFSEVHYIESLDTLEPFINSFVKRRKT
jgi:methanogenic corrinoid protein MtbC1